MKTLIILMLLLTSLSLWAAPLKCTSLGGRIEFSAENGKVFMVKDGHKAFLEMRRMPSSIGDKSVTNTFFFEGEKHIAYLQDREHPGQMGDTLSIVSPQGHQLVYPIRCQFN